MVTICHSMAIVMRSMTNCHSIVIARTDPQVPPMRVAVRASTAEPKLRELVPGPLRLSRSSNIDPTRQQLARSTMGANCAEMQRNAPDRVGGTRELRGGAVMFRQETSREMRSERWRSESQRRRRVACMGSVGSTKTRSGGEKQRQLSPRAAAQRSKSVPDWCTHLAASPGCACVCCMRR